MKRDSRGAFGVSKASPVGERRVRVGVRAKEMVQIRLQIAAYSCDLCNRFISPTMALYLLALLHSSFVLSFRHSGSDEVDFSFMTDDMSYPGRGAERSSWFASERPEGPKKEEIVAGHTCQQLGSREETYYASGFCYWLPAIHSGLRDHENEVGLALWEGSLLALGVSGEGKCIKVSTCHNNGRADGLNSTKQVENITLPKCMGEKEILETCKRKFLEAEEAEPERASKLRGCKEVRERQQTATSELDSCVTGLKQLPAEIDRLDYEIQDQNKDIAQQEEHVSKKTQEKDWAQFWKDKQCRDYVTMTDLKGKSEPAHYVESPPSCTASMQEKDPEKWLKCKHCSKEHDEVGMRTRIEDYAKQNLRQAKHQLEALESALSNTTAKLKSCKEQMSALKEAKQAMDAEWLPQKEGCDAAFSWEEGFIPKCAQQQWESSCERLCLESQAGCGVVEGRKHLGPASLEGLQVPCVPPRASWINGNESLEEQCERIARAQQPHFAQKELKAGWLWRKGETMERWKKHFAVLESGDAVRSAVLRFYEDDGWNSKQSAPMIILWDAKDVKEKEARGYGFRQGEKCFKLYHFYADYRFCADEYADGAEWMRLLRKTLRF